MTNGKDKTKGMKSAYELALERLEAQGIEPPHESRLSDEVKQAIGEARRLTEAKLAELEILHRDKLAKLADPAQRDEQEDYYRREKERLVADGDAKVRELRGEA